LAADAHQHLDCFFFTHLFARFMARRFSIALYFIPPSSSRPPEISLAIDSGSLASLQGPELATDFQVALSIKL
jgi:hypothetical protein